MGGGFLPNANFCIRHGVFPSGGMWCKGQRPWFGTRRTGVRVPASRLNGSLAHRAERRCEEAQARGSSPRGTTTRMSFNGRTSGFHPDNESSILSIRSTRC